MKNELRKPDFQKEKKGGDSHRNSEDPRHSKIIMGTAI